MEITIIISLIVALALLGVFAVRSLNESQRQLRAVNEELATRDQEISSLKVNQATLEANLDNEKRNAVEKLKVLEDSEARLKTEFENLANRIFEAKGKSLSEQNQEKMSGLLTPFRDQLEAFRKRVDEIHTEETNQSARLLQQVKDLSKLSNQVSEDANNLAKAIKGDSKRQGDWGELIVERVFEASGLRKDVEYATQVSLKDDEGKSYRPDFMVYLPEDKAVIVDSKVSLTAYERYCSVDDEAERATALKEHLKSVRKHVEELQSKDYTSLLGNKTLDFVIMCIPLEPAYQAALQSDTDLLYELARTKVIITGPTTLMLTLKLIAQIWRRENENRNAEKIADRAGRMYDQVALIIEAMLDSQRKLEATTTSFDTAMKRLRDGRGNLVSRIEQIRLLGAKVNKQIDKTVLEDATGEFEDEED
ncbi:MAG: DNA recombination protein RmuC [Opitutales bacterium]